jgi:hypothetical protein
MRSEVLSSLPRAVTRRGQGGVLRAEFKRRCVRHIAPGLWITKAPHVSSFPERQAEKERIRLSPSAKMSFNVVRADNICEDLLWNSSGAIRGGFDKFMIPAAWNSYRTSLFFSDTSDRRRIRRASERYGIAAATAATWSGISLSRGTRGTR